MLCRGGFKASLKADKTLPLRWAKQEKELGQRNVPRWLARRPISFLPKIRNFLLSYHTYLNVSIIGLGYGKLCITHLKRR